MAEPTKKAPEIEKFLTNISGSDRRISIRGNVCKPAPFGCGGLATEFTDEASRREYTISGLCQNCQDAIFGDGSDE